MLKNPPACSAMSRRQCLDCDHRQTAKANQAQLVEDI
jgi:hypothetical protein